MILFVTALALLQGVPTAPQVSFRDLPGVAVTYYDVTGRTIPEIHKSLTRAAPRDPATRKPVPANSSWSIGASVKWSRTGPRCTITGVTLAFTSSATMPRLVPQPETPAPVLAAWNRYVTRLEARHAAQLKFAYDRRGQVEQAIRASSCEGWRAAADAALTRLEEQQRRAREADATPQPKLEQPKD